MASSEKSSENQGYPCWYYDKADLKKTPSFFDGINAETEARYRREGPRFIFDMGTRLGLHHDTIATGIVFFHRFYMFHSFKKFPRHITATCCLFLAGKVEETPKKCKDLIKTARGLLNDAQFTQFGDDPREEVLTFEKVLLQTIKFDFSVEHPYKYMLQYAKALKGERSKIEKLVQMSWTFINDSLCTSLCLQWEPQIVAVAVMYLAGRLCKFEPQDWAYNRGRWWEQFIDDISMDLLEDICHQVLDQYSHAKLKASSTSKSKRERPKTPGDVQSDKSTEPQAKTSRLESHSKPSSSQKIIRSSSSTTTPVSDHPTSHGDKSKLGPPTKKVVPPAPTTVTRMAPVASLVSSTPVHKNLVTGGQQRRSNTEVVAMDTTIDNPSSAVLDPGVKALAQAPVKLVVPNPPPQQSTALLSTSAPMSSASQTPTRVVPPPATDAKSYMNNVNQYQTFIGTADPATMGYMQQYASTSAAPPPVQSYKTAPLPSQFMSAQFSVQQQGYQTSSGATTTQLPSYNQPPPHYHQQYPSSTQPQQSVAYRGDAPKQYQSQQPPYRSPSQSYQQQGVASGLSATGLATVRITGRRDQKVAPHQQWL